MFAICFVSCVEEQEEAYSKFEERFVQWVDAHPCVFAYLDPPMILVETVAAPPAGIADVLGALPASTVPENDAIPNGVGTFALYRAHDAALVQHSLYFCFCHKFIDLNKCHPDICSCQKKNCT